MIDGDTVAVRARIWPGQFVETRVRVAGIDTPERRGPACEAELLLAQTATDFTQAWLTAPSTSRALFLHQVETGSFAGRVIADISRADGARLGPALTEAGLAVPFGAASPWCDSQIDSAPAPR